MFKATALLATLVIGGCELTSSIGSCDDMNPRCSVPDLRVEQKAGIITKSEVYNGAKLDPQLKTLSACPDYNTDSAQSLEPNDSISTASVPTFSVPPDQSTPTLTNLAICPTGNNPLTGAHDIDYFRVDLSSFPDVKSLVASITYQVAYGDLDVAILNASGAQLSADGTASDNGCTTAVVTATTYYVLVAGAGNVDVNNYTLDLHSYSTSTGCQSSANHDLVGVIQDMSIPDSSGVCKAQAALCDFNSECCSQSCTFGTCN